MLLHSRRTQFPFPYRPRDGGLVNSLPRFRLPRHSIQEYKTVENAGTRIEVSPLATQRVGVYPPLPGIAGIYSQGSPCHYLVYRHDGRVTFSVSLNRLAIRRKCYSIVSR